MADEQYYIAVDLGAESGRVMRGKVTSETMELKEIYRFQTGPSAAGGAALRWDMDSIWGHILKGIKETVKACPKQPAGIGVDSWGVDYGLFDENGCLLEDPFHYRDRRTDEIMEQAFAVIRKQDIYQRTGIQFLQFNTLYQLYAHKLANSEVFKTAKHLVLMADIFTFFLSGEMVAEYTLASTTQLMDMATGQWSESLFRAFDIPVELMPRIVQPGTVVGTLHEDMAREFGCDPIPVISVASHDTGSAVAGIPATGDDWAFLSSGTWSLMGVEVPDAVIDDLTYHYEFTNEGGVCGTIRLLKNIMGLWIVQQCKRQWDRERSEMTYEMLTRLASEAKPFMSFLDPDCKAFFGMGNMPQRLEQYFYDTSQPIPSDRGQMVRVVLESLALKYRRVLENIEEASDRKLNRLHVVGGGIQNTLLNQFTANATGRPVIAGPVEATAAGNVLMQAMATEQIDSLKTGREIIGRSFEMTEYQPEDVQAWQKRYWDIEDILLGNTGEGGEMVKPLGE